MPPHSPTPQQKLLILGTRSFAEEVAELVRETPGFEMAGFMENLDQTRCQEQIDGMPVHWVTEGARLADQHQVLCGIGSAHRERFVADAAEQGLTFATIVHPTAHIAASTTLGVGCLVSVRVVIAAKGSLGDHVIVNRGALIGHHTTIGHFTTIGPGANIAGNCHIGNRVNVAMSAVVLNGLTVGDGSVVAAGAVVTKDVPPHTQVMGIPARVVKENIEVR